MKTISCSQKYSIYFHQRFLEVITAHVHLTTRLPSNSSCSPRPSISPTLAASNIFPPPGAPKPKITSRYAHSPHFIQDPCSDFLNPSYGWSKSTESEILSSSSKIVGVKKKRHGFNKPFWDLKWIGYQTYHVRTLFYSYDDPQCNIEAVSFFLDAATLWKKILRFDPTLSSNNSGSKPSNFEKYYIFGKVWTSAFT